MAAQTVTAASPTPRPAPHPLPEQGAWTYQDWLALPDDGYRYEVIDGVLHMSPPPEPQHAATSANLQFALESLVRANKLGRIFAAPTGVRLPDHPVPLQPDLFFISSEQMDVIGEKYIEGAPDLIVEILSPSNWLYDRREKMQVYEASGVREYWIVDYRAQTVEVYVLEERSYRLLGKWGQGEQAESRVIADFSIPISEVFDL